MSAIPVLLERLQIWDLFGPGSPEIDITFRQVERVTVLHGRNGSGKTVTLELLSALRDGRYSVLMRYPFSKLVLHASDNSKLVIDPRGAKKGVAGKKKEAPIALNFVVEQWKKPASGLLPAKGVLGRSASRRSEMVLHEMGFRMVGPGMWRGPAGEILSEDEMRKVHPSLYAEYEWHLNGAGPKEDAVLKEWRESLQPVKIIRTDRLYARMDDDAARDERDFVRGPRTKLMVEHLSQKIQALVKEADQTYRLNSTRLDASLPERLFTHLETVPDLDSLRKESRELREHEARLQNIGLLKPQSRSIDESSLSPDQRSTFAIILQDRKEKLAAFTDLANRAQRLLESLSKKLAPKTIKLNVDSGYRIETPAGVPLPLDQLSSGEQHELVLLHELLFDIEPFTFILIDEPELSLHIAWQSELLDELLGVARLSNLYFCLATHSPYIVGDPFAHLLVQLGESL